MVNLINPEAWNSETIGHPPEYFKARDISIDCRGPVRISGLSKWGLNIRTYTVSHDLADFDETVLRPLQVDDYAWICSDVVLYNTHIGEGAIVACGSVVRSRDVPPWTMCEGNPARIIAEFDHEREKWIYLRESWPLPTAAGWKGTIE